MPEILVNFGEFGMAPYTIDNNARYTLGWSTSCMNNLNQSCSDAPTYVNETLDLSSNITHVIGPYSAQTQGGYRTSGSLLRGDMIVNIVESSTPYELTTNIHAAEVIYDDVWQYGVKNQSCGQFAMGIDSQWLPMIASDNQIAYWSIELGNVVD